MERLFSRRDFLSTTLALGAIGGATLLTGCTTDEKVDLKGGGVDSGNALAKTPYSDGPQSIRDIAKKLCEGYNLEELTGDDKDYTIQMGYYNCDHMAAASVGDATGIYDLLGLKVAVTGTSNMPEAMATGAMDAAYCNYQVSLNAALKGVQVFVAAENHIGGSYYLVAKKEITDPKDLVGKRIALGKDPETSSDAWITCCNELGIPKEASNYENFTMSDSDEYLALVSGSLDACTTCDPWGSMAEYSGVGHILWTDNPVKPNGLHGTCCKLAMSRSFADAHPKLAERICLAHSICIQFMYEHPFYAAQLFSAYYNVPVEVSLMTYWRKFVKEGRTIRWDLNKDYIKNQQDYCRENGIREDINGLDLRDYCDMTYMDACGAIDFEQFIKDNIDEPFPEGMEYEDFKKKAMAIDGAENYDTSQYEEKNS